MDIQSSALNQLFVLYPVIIQGWISPVKPADLAHGGIPKSLYDGEPKGLECLIDPWAELQLQSLSWDMAVDDRVDLYVNNDPTPVTGKTVDPGEEQSRIRLYISHGRLLNGLNGIRYKVTRPGGNSAYSRDLNVLYYLRAPGDPAPQGMDLVIPPDVLGDGVSAARAAQGVEFGFTCSNLRDHSRIRFQIGDETVEWDITDASVPVTKKLFTDTFQRVGDSPHVPLDFVVFDQLGNFNRSSTKQIDVHLRRIDLSSAILREILSDNNDDPSKVDLVKLHGNPLSALIHLVDTIWKVGDFIKLAFTAELNDNVVATHELTTQITTVPNQFVWSIDNNKIIADSTVKVVYQQVRGGEVIASSIPASAQVVGALDPVRITSVKDLAGRDIFHGYETVARSVVLSGTAQVGANVEIYDGAQFRGSTVATDGRWEAPITELSLGEHRFSASYTRGSAEFWSIRVVELAPPRLLSIVSELGISYPSGTKIPFNYPDRKNLMFTISCQSLPYERRLYLKRPIAGYGSVMVPTGANRAIVKSGGTIDPGRIDWVIDDDAGIVSTPPYYYWNTFG
ncbi:hypothetical protein [Pseudomonas sp. A34-9]|uniref:hypothetical protein n=1 Tax=Pseudomonas sp. A34-9 TaxID=3034675 RepID=UPI00240E68DE|nr:hypothetical protein [Pseudomonas sp. A34-9]